MISEEKDSSLIIDTRLPQGGQDQTKLRIDTRTHPIVRPAQFGPTFFSPTLQVLPLTKSLEHTGFLRPIVGAGDAWGQPRAVDQAIPGVLDAVGGMWIVQREIEAQWSVFGSMPNCIDCSQDHGPIEIIVIR